jgi:hypothetical protein
MRACRATVKIIVPLVLVTIGSMREARAQAWVGDKGALDVSLDYNLGISDKVIGDGTTGPEGKFIKSGTTTHQVTLGLEYVPINRLAISVSLPFVALKYTGDKTAYPHPGGASYDNGKTHATLTDLRSTIRYAVLRMPVALSPHIGFTLPVADYETVGNTVGGRHLKAISVGAGVGTLFDSDTYIHALYEYSFVEKYDRTPDTAKAGQNRSDASFTLGQKLYEQRVDLHADANLRVTHGGLAFHDYLIWTPDEKMYHDPILRESIFLVGAGIGYQVSNSFSLQAAARLFVKGYNTQNASVIAVGMTWSPL